MSGRKQGQKRSKSAGKAPGKGPPGGKRKRGSVGDTLPDFEDQQDVFHDSDREKASDDESEEELQETAEEKRLRLGEPMPGRKPRMKHRLCPNMWAWAQSYRGATTEGRGLYLSS